jgi:hypothetical protein
MGLALPESTNLLVSPTITLSGCSNDVQRRNLLILILMFGGEDYPF